MHAKLLLVEDDPAIAALMRQHLEQAGYAVRHEHDGGVAARVLRDDRFDLVLLDLGLPGQDGWDLCRQLRSPVADAALAPYTPLIIVSARSAEAHRVLGLELGADDYLAKPFSMLELVARVRALLRRVAALQTPTPQDSSLRLGGFSLDAARRELRGPHGVVPLTLREYDLLRFLARHPGRPFSRAELLSRVWGEGFDGYEHTVNSHINRLRAKLGADPLAAPLIETVWGVGYRFAEASRALP